VGRKKEREGERAKLERRLEKLGRRLDKARRKHARLDGAEEPSGTVAWVSPEQPPEWGPGPLAPHDVFGAMEARRSVKKFTERRVARSEIERLLSVAALAPNHRLTEPWRFYVLGAESRRQYGDVLGGRKARKMEDADAAALVRAKVAGEHEALPAMIAVAMTVSEDAEQTREDFAATFMAIQNLALAAVALGLGTHIKTGAVMDDPDARAAVGVNENERIVAVVNLGEPETLPSPRSRTPAADVTVWRD
jgi:nitroreductase